LDGCFSSIILLGYRDGFVYVKKGSEIFRGKYSDSMRFYSTVEALEMDTKLYGEFTDQLTDLQNRTKIAITKNREKRRLKKELKKPLM